MKRNKSELAHWNIELRDGALQVQRAYAFEDAAAMDAFGKSLGRHMTTPHLSVMVTPSLELSPVVTVRMDLLPELALLSAAGDIASACDREYTMIQDLATQTAA